MREFGEGRPNGAADYYYRRELGVRDLLPAVGAAVATGLVAFYIARLMLQRTPLAPEQDIPVVGERGTIVRRPVRQPARG